MYIMKTYPTSDLKGKGTSSTQKGICTRWVVKWLIDNIWCMRLIHESNQ